MNLESALVNMSIMLVVLSLGIFFVGRKLYRLGLALQTYFRNRKARQRLDRMQVSTKRSVVGKPSASAVAKAANRRKTIVITPFSEVIDYSIYDEPVVAVRDRLEAFIERACSRRQNYAEKLGLTTLVVPSRTDSAEPVVDDSPILRPVEERVASAPEAESKPDGFLDEIRNQLNVAFETAPEAGDEIPPFLRKQAV